MLGAIRHLYSEAGLGRYYHGLGPALIQGPIGASCGPLLSSPRPKLTPFTSGSAFWVARFGDTFCNSGILALLSSNPFLARLPSPLQTAFASIAAALFRMILVPIDTLKTTMQTQGQGAVRLLKERVGKYGVGTLWYGAWATAAASFVGSFPCSFLTLLSLSLSLSRALTSSTDAPGFATYNYLSTALPPPQSPFQKLARQALIGFLASVVSDSISNSLRVVKTYRQVNRTRVSYRCVVPSPFPSSFFR